MSYGGKGQAGHGYNSSTRNSVGSTHFSRSNRSQKMDERFKAPIAKSETAWEKDPSHSDLVGVDTPKSTNQKYVDELTKDSSGLKMLYYDGMHRLEVHAHKESPTIHVQMGFGDANLPPEDARKFGLALIQSANALEAVKNSH